MTPSLGAMLGTSHNPEILAEINAESGGGVIFGQVGDPYAERYRNIRLQMEQLDLVNLTVQRTAQAIQNPDVYMAITDVNDAYVVPECMKLPILLYQPVRTLLEEHRIYGYGIKPENLPKGDVFGRLLDNGKSVINDGEKVEGGREVTFTWEWMTDDPKVTEDDLDKIKETREWLDFFLQEQMKINGDWRDPTDPGNTISRKAKKE